MIIDDQKGIDEFHIKYKIAVDTEHFLAQSDGQIPNEWLSFTELMESASCELSKEEALEWDWEGSPSRGVSRSNSAHSSRSNSPVRGPNAFETFTPFNPSSSSTLSPDVCFGTVEKRMRVERSNKKSFSSHAIDLRDESEREKVKVSLQDPILLYFTSGTTGEPKMVRHCGTYPLAFAPISRWTMQLQENDIIWSLSDTGWAKTAYGKLFGQWTIGCAVVQFQQDRFDPHKALKLIEQCAITVLCLPPTAYRMLINATDFEQPGAYDLSSLRHCISSGEPLNPKVIQVWKKITGLDIYDFYGQTETTVLASNFPGIPIRQGSMGFPFPGLDLCLLDENGQRITEPRQEGSIALYIGDRRPPGLLLDFWRAEEAFSERFSNGFYLTGDRAYRDVDGYLWYVGRDDDVFKASGYRIGPFEVESALMQHESVIEAAVIGVPDETRGLVVKAFVVLKAGWQGSPSLTLKLQDHVKNITAPYKYPRLIEYVSTLPKTNSGKIKRNELRATEFQRALESDKSLFDRPPSPSSPSSSSSSSLSLSSSSSYSLPAHNFDQESNSYYRALSSLSSSTPSHDAEKPSSQHDSTSHQ